MSRFIRWINTINNRFWVRISTNIPVNVASLCIFRIITGLFLLIIFLPDFTWMSKLPRAFFRPPVLSLANLSTGFPNKYFFLALDVLLLVASLCITTGIKAKIASRIFVILSLVGLNFQYSFGKIDHSILLYCLLFCLSFTNWGTQLSLVPDKIRHSKYDQKALSLFAVLICFAFFSAGFEKALKWINSDFNSSGTANWMYTGYYAFDRQFLLAPWGKSFPFGAQKLMDYCAVVFELSPLVMLLISPRSWKIWLLTACIFHIMNTLFLNISFTFNAIIYLVFCDFSFLYKAIATLLSRAVFRLIAVPATVLIVVLRLTNIFTCTAASNLFFSGRLIEANLYVATLVWILITLIFIKASFKIEREKMSA